MNYNIAHPFTRNARISPDSTALALGKTQLSYGQLLRSVRTLGSRLHCTLNSGRIGILATRSIEACAGILATAWAGGTYVPLGQKLPESRLLQLFERLDLDALVVDMPPGTGDVQLSLSQLLAVAGSVVVTTPQDVAFADVRRAIKMFSMTKTEVIGLVENMSGFTCTSCGTEHQIFGSGNLEAHAAEAGLDILARIPMDGVTAVAADGGEPIVVAAPDGAAATAYRTLAENLWTRLNADTTEGLEERFPSFFDMKQG